MPENLNITAAQLESTPAGLALLSGRLSATVKGTTGHITVRMVCKLKDGSTWRACEFKDASHIFLTVPAADGGFADKIGTYYAQGKHEGMFWSVRSADATRIKAALYVFAAITGKNDGKHMLQSTYCFRCGRELTEPESIESGFGPTCGERAYASTHQVKVKSAEPVEAPVPSMTPAEFIAPKTNADYFPEPEAPSTEAQRAAIVAGTDDLTAALKAGLQAQRDPEYMRSPEVVQEDRKTLEDARAAIVAVLAPTDKASDVLAQIESAA
jgi:hypothetical protein